MPISTRQKQIGIFLLGVTLLTPALFMAQIFWGVHISFALFSLIPPYNGLVALLTQSILGAIVAAVPFGILFGLAVPTHTRRSAIIFALVPAAAIYGFSIWVAVFYHPIPLTHPHWLLRASDTLLFIVLFPLFAYIGARMGLHPKYRWQKGASLFLFGVLALAYYFGFSVYFAYIYTPRV